MLCNLEWFPTNYLYYLYVPCMLPCYKTYAPVIFCVNCYQLTYLQTTPVRCVQCDIISLYDVLAWYLGVLPWFPCWMLTLIILLDIVASISFMLWKKLMKLSVIACICWCYICFWCLTLQFYFVIGIYITTCLAMKLRCRLFVILCLVDLVLQAFQN